MAVEYDGFYMTRPVSGKEKELRRRKLIKMMERELAKKQDRVVDKAPELRRLFSKSGKDFAVLSNGAVYEYSLYARNGQLYLELKHKTGQSNYSLTVEQLESLSVSEII
tara:strand:- start:97 stop:423 length:327 start_codon:yes stop_codon:yes gene_type:complete